MYEKLVSHKFDTGTLNVTKDDYDDDESLFKWVKKQKTILALHFQNKPISISLEQVIQSVPPWHYSCIGDCRCIIGGRPVEWDAGGISGIQGKK